MSNSNLVSIQYHFRGHSTWMVGIISSLMFMLLRLLYFQKSRNHDSFQDIYSLLPLTTTHELTLSWKKRVKSWKQTIRFLQELRKEIRNHLRNLHVGVFIFRHNWMPKSIFLPFFYNSKENLKKYINLWKLIVE